MNALVVHLSGKCSNGQSTIAKSTSPQQRRRQCPAPDIRGESVERNDGRVARTEEIERVIGDWVAAHDLDDVLALLERADVPSGKIYDIADIARDAHYAAREMIREFRLPDGTEVKLPGVVPKMSETPGQTRWVGPALGEHTAEVLRSLGYSEERQADLKQRGVI